MAEEPGKFSIRSAIRDVRLVARGRGIRKRLMLEETYGGRNWKKMSGIARIEEDNGYYGDAEIHWYEAHGVGRVDWKVKRRLGIR